MVEISRTVRLRLRGGAAGVVEVEGDDVPPPPPQAMARLRVRMGVVERFGCGNDFMAGLLWVPFPGGKMDGVARSKYS
jgi:hypothetical protein